MANAAAEPEPNESTVNNVVSPPASSPDEKQEATLAVKIKKERATETPDQLLLPPQPPPPSLILNPPAVSQEDQLRQLLQQTPTVSSTAAVSPVVTTINGTILRSSSTSNASSNSRVNNCTLPSNQRTIDSYFTSKNNSVAAAAAPATTDCSKEDECKTPPVDLESVRGIFGWTTLEGVYIPFILRGEERFTAVRIIEKSLLKKFLQALPPDVYSCTYIKSYFITEVEAKLLNEINIKHCDRYYGNDNFSIKDLVVLLNDVEQLYEFLSTCYYKLTRPSANGSQLNNGRCGIIKIERSAIPYVLRNDVRYVPLSLFEQSSAIKALDLKAEKLELWEMSYVKFCCKVAGISDDFIRQDSCLVVSLDDLQHTVGTKLHFEEWWPSSSTASVSTPNVTQRNHIHQPNKIDSKDSKYQRVVEKSKNDALLNDNEIQRNLRASLQQPPLPRALPASGWYDPGSGVITESVRGSISSSREQQIAAKSSSRTVTSQNLNSCQNGIISSPSSSVSSYPISDLLSPAFQLSTALPLSKLQAYLCSGQYWGAASSYLQSGYPTQMPMVCQNPSLDRQVGDHRRMEQARSMRATSNVVQAHSNSGRMPSKSNYTLPIQNQVASALMLPPMLQVNSDLLSRDCRKDSKSHDEQRSPFYPDGQYRGLPKVASSHHTVASSILNGSRESSVLSNGIRTSTTRATTSTSSSNLQNITDSFLAKHLLGINRTSPRLENYVVAPGNVQSLAGKMSSPKPANQVPAHVSNYQNCRIPIQLDSSKTMTSHSATSAGSSLDMFVGSATGQSKLHQLLSTSSTDSAPMEPQDLSIGNRIVAMHNSSKLRNSATSNPSSHDVGGYEVQHLNVSGIKFRAIVTVLSHSKGPPMVPLSELERRILPLFPTDYYEQILTKGLGVQLYKSSRGQVEILKKYGNCTLGDKSSLLICADDLKRCLPHLQKFACTMTKLRTPHMDEAVQSKRLRMETETAVT
ncbi:hypothetical protein CHUAL_009043 [Chamberlinius hualienensis]